LSLQTRNNKLFKNEWKKLTTYFVDINEQMKLTPQRKFEIKTEKQRFLKLKKNIRHFFFNSKPSNLSNFFKEIRHLFV